MTRLFLYGALADPELAGIVLGRAGMSSLPGHVEGFGLPEDAETCFTLAHPAADAALEGLILDGVTEEEWARVRFLHEGLGAREDRCNSDRGALVIFVSADRKDLPASPGTNADWAGRWKRVALSALREAMSYFGRISGQTLKQRFPMILARAAARVAAKRAKPAHVRSDMARDAVQVIGQAAPHAGFFVTRQYDLRHPMFAGRMSPRVTREVFVATDAAIVLPYDARNDRVLLVEQFRMGPFGRGDARPWILEPVAGRVDAGETPEQAARRECAEEAGLNLTGLEHISSHYCSPGCSTEYFHLYLGLCDLPETVRGAGGLDSEDEDIRTHVLSFADAMDLLATGEADNGPLVLSLIWLQRERTRLRAAA